MTPDQWSGIGQRRNPSWYLDPLVASQKREENLNLLRGWLPKCAPKRLLKTDLFEEAYGQDSLWTDLLGEATVVIGMDVALPTARNASKRCSAGSARFLTADVRSLPLCSESIDLIFSNSTLDHFGSGEDFKKAVGELARVLRPGGRLIITLDNPWNLLYYPLRWASLSRIIPFYLGFTTTSSGLARALTDARLEVRDTALLIHNPRGVSTLLFLAIRRLARSYSDGAIRLLLRAFSQLRRLPTRNLTACFISACAEKPIVSSVRGNP